MRQFATVCVLSALCGVSHPRAAPTPAARVSSPQPPAYRLGTAARPFAWSTAIGDLNADGRPDIAIADRVGSRGSGEYSLEVSIAGKGSQSVIFDAPDDALVVTLRDVDHDHDLDVVVSGALTRAIVHVWLNDGTGRFEDSSSLPFPPEWQAAPASIDVEERAAGEVAVGVAPRTNGAGLAPPSASFAVLAQVDRALAVSEGPSLAHLSTCIRPRAPPLATRPFAS